MNRRVIAHLDMDAFYASVELLRYPELRDRPVVIGGGSRHSPRTTIDPVSGATTRAFATLRHYAGRGVVTTATYAARALGVHSAMPMMHAAQLAPDAVLLPVDFDAYHRYSRLFKAAVRVIAPCVEDRGIDEIYIDLTDVAAPAGLRALAQSLKDAVRVATGLAASIGVAENKLLAKIASDLDKPDGLTVIGDGDLERRIWPLPARKINGIGPKSAARLADLQIHTIGDLARTGREVLVERFGRAQGQWMHESSHGRDAREVVTCSEPRSISRETTFERDLSVKRDRELLSGVFTDLCSGVSNDLRRKGYAGRTVGVKLRYDNFVIVTRDKTITAPTQDALEIRRAAGACLKRVALERRIRLLGVRMSGLVPADAAAATRANALAEPATSSLFDPVGPPGA